VVVGETSTIRDLGSTMAGSERALVTLRSVAILLRHFAVSGALFLAISALSAAQSNPSLRSLHNSRRQSPPSPFTHLKPPTRAAPYEPFTPQQRLRWFTANTMDPPNLAGEMFEAAFGTAPNRPREYGPHWGGFARRYGIGMTRNATGNAIEAGVGLALREDPRYFRAPDQPFGARVRNVVRLAFAARAGTGSFRPAYVRYVAVLGTNLLSNCWTARTEANTHDALLRSAEGFGGLLAANTFEEFWPDVKKRLFHKHH